MVARHAPSVGAEFAATLRLSVPLAAAHIAHMLMGFTDAAMLGRLSSEALAAGGLGAGLYFAVVTVFQGVFAAVGALAAQGIGAGRLERVGTVTGQGFVLALLLSPPAILLVLGLPTLLLAMGQPPALVGDVAAFLEVIVWGLPAGLFFGVLRGFLTAVARPRAITVVVVLCIGVNALLNYLLIFGHGGLPALGIAGSAAATAIVSWTMAAALALYVVYDRALRRFRIFGEAARWRGNVLGELLRLGWPIGGIYGMETGLFATVGALMGLVGTDALAAHQLVLNMAALSFMVPFSIGQAATVRVGLGTGARDRTAARHAGFVALALGVGFMACCALVFIAIPRGIVALYLDIDDPANAGVLAIAVPLLAIAALFQVFDGAQAVASGALRGLGDTRVPMLVGAFGYWGIGLVAGWALGFPLGWGAVGLWCGLALGLAVAAVLLTLRFATLTRASPAGLALWAETSR